MPGRPPGNIGKGSNLTKVDAIANSFRRQEFLDALNDWGRDYLQILENYAGTTRDETDYLRASWYNENGFWPTNRYPKIHHPLEPIVRASLIKAIEAAKARNLPIDTYWISAGDEFKAIITASAQQVTRVVLTPPSPDAAPPHRSLVDIWVVERGEDGASAVQAAPGVEVTIRGQVPIVITHLNALVP
jgi:hypothetical protein